MNIDESFKAYKRDDLKTLYRIKLDNESVYHERCVITKILKFGKNNQYCSAMTKPMPTGCMKERFSPSWLKFHLKTVDLYDEIEHLFVVDIDFDKKGSTEREYMHNVILPSLKNKKF